MTMIFEPRITFIPYVTKKGGTNFLKVWQESGRKEQRQIPGALEIVHVSYAIVEKLEPNGSWSKVGEVQTESLEEALLFVGGLLDDPARSF